jgi:hypothetical protein
MYKKGGLLWQGYFIYFSLAAFLSMQLILGCSSRQVISLEKIKKDIVGNKTGYDIIRDTWTVAQEELRQITIVESIYEGDKANILVDIKTADGTEKGAGRLRLHYNWSNDKWSLRKVENLTFRQISRKQSIEEKPSDSSIT